jgi:hypothetical protein
MEDLINIIIPAYNAEKTLKKYGATICYCGYKKVYNMERLKIVLQSLKKSVMSERKYLKKLYITQYI